MSDDPSLKEHLLALMAADRRHCAAVREADREAVRTALEAANKRFESTNEWRQTYGDDRATFVRKDTFDTAIASLADKVSTLGTAATELRGRGSGLNAAWVYALGAIAAVGTGISIIVLLTGPAKPPPGTAVTTAAADVAATTTVEEPGRKGR